jgi:hypothetical protein
MQFRLRTLLILLAILPPLLTVEWWVRDWWRKNQEWERAVWGGFHVVEPAPAPLDSP